MVPSSWPGRGFVTRPPCGISGRLLPVVALNSGLFLGGCCLSFVHSVFLCSLWLSLRTFQPWAGAVDLLFGSVDLVFSVAGLVVSTIRSAPLYYTWFGD